MALRFNLLTRPAIKNLARGERINEHGISAERLANGDCRYSVNIMVDGQRIHRVIGRESEGITREQAERAIEGFRTKAREGRLDLPTGRKTHRTFEQAGEEYLTRIEHHNKNGRNYPRKLHHMRERLIPHFKAVRPDKLSDIAIAGYTKRRRGEDAAPATINRELSTLSHFLNCCLAWGWIKQRPKIDKAAEARKQITVLLPAEQHKLMQAAIGDQDPLTWLFVAIAIGTGMRHSEVVRVQWSEIDFTQRRIYIGKAKAGQREQPMPPSLATRLQQEWTQLGEPTGYIFPVTRKDGKNPHRSTMAGQFRRTVIRAGLLPSKVTPHILRHTAITALVTAGVDLPTIQRISGHKTLAMILRYTQLSNAHVDRSMENLDAAFSATVTPELHTGQNGTSTERDAIGQKA
jgi:integrase